MRILQTGAAYGWWGEFDPARLDDPTGPQVGGGETAMLNACWELAARGHEVVCSFRCKPGDHRGVRFAPNEHALRLAIEEGPWDAIVSWDDAPLFNLPIDARVKVLSNQMNSIDMNARGAPDWYVSPSETHADLLAATYGLPRDRFVAIPNAVNPAWYSFDAPRDPYRVVYASSPDRGLHHVLRLWPEVVRREPRAHLHVYYEIDRWIEMTSAYRGFASEVHALANWVRSCRRDLASARVTFEGAVSPRRVVSDLCASGVLAYPCDTVCFTEGYGTVPQQAHVAGCAVVLTDTDAFAEVYGGGALDGAHGEKNPLVPRGEIDALFVDRVIWAMEIMARRVAERDPAHVHCELDGFAFTSKPAWNKIATEASWSAVGDRWVALLEKAMNEAATRAA